MKASVLLRVFSLCLATAPLLGCSGASWRKFEADSPYQAPAAMTIAIVSRPSMKAAAEALSRALLDSLDSHGIKATVIPETSGTPDVTVSIVKWDPGSQGQRWWTLTVGGRGEVVVEVDSLAVDGTAEGWVRGGFLGGQDENSAEAVGDLIAESLATGRQSNSRPVKAQGRE